MQARIKPNNFATLDRSSTARWTRCRTFPNQAATTCWSCTPSSTPSSSSSSSQTSSPTQRRRTSTKGLTSRPGRVLDSRPLTFPNSFTLGLSHSCGQVNKWSFPFTLLHNHLKLNAMKSIFIFPSSEPSLSSSSLS